MKKIILTGGGTAGHVTPNIALLPSLIKEGFEIVYIGSKAGIEKELVEKCGIEYYSVSSGKLRRYVSIKNVTDMARVVKGLGDAMSLMKKIKPDIIFSKGGFVSVPVVMAGNLHKVPVIVHESDMTPGLANKLAMPFANKICATFPETMNHLAKKKSVLTGAPIRAELFRGSKINGLKICGFRQEKPVILVMGGSLGSVAINQCVRGALNTLLPHYNIVHICGKKNVDSAAEREGYKQYEYISKELQDMLALSEIVVSRAGSNSINEFLALKKPSLLIPLSKKASRGDQILNSESFARQGFSKLIFEEELTADILCEGINELYKNRGKYIAAMNNSKLNDGVFEVMKVINSCCKK